jgi:predicted nucleic acid-binding protein
MGKAGQTQHFRSRRSILGQPPKCVAQIIIADAVPLIAIAKTNQLQLLQQMFNQVWIPVSVENECLAKPGKDADRITIAIKDGWLVVKTAPKSQLPVPNALGAGELDSIQLALQSPKTSLLIVDDRLARRQALIYKLNIIGTVRLLDIAEKQGIIPSAEQIIQEMTDQGYRISPTLLQQIRGENC